jgi:hypothetical protein
MEQHFFLHLSVTTGIGTQVDNISGMGGGTLQIFGGEVIPPIHNRTKNLTFHINPTPFLHYRLHIVPPLPPLLFSPPPFPSKCLLMAIMGGGGGGGGSGGSCGSSCGG